MAADIEIKSGDRLPALSATLRDANSVPLNLTGWTVVFSMTAVGGTTPKVNRQAASVTDATNGGVSYNWGATDTDTAGIYWGEFEATRTLDGKTETHPNHEKGIVILVTGALA